MSGNNELNRRRFLKSIASSGALAGVFLTDHLGPLDGGLWRGEAQATQQGPGDVGGQQGFGSVAVESQNLLLRFAVEDTGIALTQIRNKTTGFEHLSRPSPFLFRTSVSSLQVSAQALPSARKHGVTLNGSWFPPITLN